MGIKSKIKILILLTISSGILLVNGFFFLESIYAFSSVKVTMVESSDSPIKLLTYNIHQFEHSFDTKPEQLLDIFQTLDADIIGLQEATGTSRNTTIIDNAWYAQQLQMYHFISDNYLDHVAGVSILSRWPFLNQSHLLLPGVDSPFVRGVVIVAIDSPYGDIIVINTHLNIPQYQADRLEHVKKIINLTANYSHAILMGDFNTPDTIIDEPYRLLTSTYTDVWPASGKLPLHGSTWPVTFPVLRIDYIWLWGNNWGVIRNSARLIGNSTTSDHLGVYAEIVLNQV